MQVLNIDERRIARPPAEVGALIDTLASDSDALWPRTLWPALRFDRPLSVGADGGHGPIRYSVVEFVPGRFVKFRFSGPRGFDGHHWFEIVPEAEDACRLRHTIEMQARGPALVTWPLAIRHLHDALIEDAFTTAEASLGVPLSVKAWPARVKLLRRLLAGGKVRPQGFEQSPRGVSFRP